MRPSGPNSSLKSSLVHTLPITKKNKYTVVTEAQKECTCAAYALAKLLQKANSGSNWRLSSEQVGGTECSFVCHVPAGPRGISLGYFCPSRASSQCYSQVSGASRFQHRLSSFLLTKYGSRGWNAVGCANTNEHRPTNTRSSSSAPEAVLSEVEQRFDCVQAQTHMYPSLVGGFHPHPEPNSSPPSPKSYPLHR
jgi:hypothetical protein